MFTGHLHVFFFEAPMLEFFLLSYYYICLFTDLEEFFVY